MKRLTDKQIEYANWLATRITKIDIRDEEHQVYMLLRELGIDEARRMHDVLIDAARTLERSYNNNPNHWADESYYKKHWSVNEKALDRETKSPVITDEQKALEPLYTWDTELTNYQIYVENVRKSTDELRKRNERNAKSAEELKRERPKLRVVNA